MSESFPRTSYKHLSIPTRQHRLRPLRPMLDVRAERTARTKAMAQAHLEAAARDPPDAGELRSRAEKMLRCCHQLVLRDTLDENSAVRTKAKAVYRCNLRNCANCEAQRRLRNIRHVEAVFAAALEQRPGLRVLCLTLTVPNVAGDQLSGAVDAMNSAFIRMTRQQLWKKAVAGFLRVLEVTWSAKHQSCHPHYHCLICVDGERYFKGDAYLTQPQWKVLWGTAYGHEHVIVDVRTPKPRSKSTTVDQAVSQALKYPWSGAEFTEETPEGFKVDPDVLQIFHAGLKGKRTYAFGGFLRQVAFGIKTGSADAELLPGEGEVADPYLFDTDEEPALPHIPEDDVIAETPVHYEPGTVWHRPSYQPDKPEPSKE